MVHQTFSPKRRMGKRENDPRSDFAMRIPSRSFPPAGRLCGHQKLMTLPIHNLANKADRSGPAPRAPPPNCGPQKDEVWQLENPDYYPHHHPFPAPTDTQLTYLPTSLPARYTAIANSPIVELCAPVSARPLSDMSLSCADFRATLAAGSRHPGENLASVLPGRGHTLLRRQEILSHVLAEYHIEDAFCLGPPGLGALLAGTSRHRRIYVKPRDDQ